MKKRISYFMIICLSFSIFCGVDSGTFSRTLDRNQEDALDSLQGSCSIITCTVGDEVLFGYNHDGHEDLEPYILFGDHIPFSDGENSSFGKPICNTGRMLPNGPRDSYAKLTTDGLCFAYNSLPSISMYIDPYKENYSDTVVDPGVDFWNGPLYECSTVEEITAFYNQYNYFYPSPNPQWSWQEQWADAEGNAVVVGLDKDGNVTFTEMNESQYMISTNFNLAYPESCDGPCSGSTWRYNKASEMLQNIVEEKTLTVDAIRDVLEAISVESTVHSLVFNPKTLDIYVYYRHDFSKVFRFNIEEELSTLPAGEVRLYNLREMYERAREDLDGSGTINIVDIAIVAKAFGSQPGDSNWNQAADFDKNGVINIIDITKVAKNYGKSL